MTKPLLRHLSKNPGNYQPSSSHHPDLNHVIPDLRAFDSFGLGMPFGEPLGEVYVSL